jgi:hypothetical protein
MVDTFKDTAMMAVDSAKSVVNLITQDADMNMAFVGLPHYFHTMIAFACSFLLKITTKYRQQIDTDAQPIFDMIKQVVDLCKGTVPTPHHLMHWMGEGLQSLLTTCMTATANIERRQQLRDTLHFAHAVGVDVTQTSPTPMILPNQGLSSQYGQSEDLLDSVQCLANVWDTAREAAMIFPGERSVSFDDYPTQDPLYLVNDTGQGKMSADGTGNVWDASLAFFDVEHMGFGLL